MACVAAGCTAMRHDGGDAPPTLPPDYGRIAQLVRQPSGPFFLDSLQARFDRCDTTLGVDDLRCLYYGGADVSLCDAWQRYRLLLGRFGRHAGKANDAWWQYQMLLTAVWSTGDGSAAKPLHAMSAADADHLRAVDGVENIALPPDRSEK